MAAGDDRQGDGRGSRAQSTRHSSDRTLWIVLTAATLLAAVIRFPFLGHQSLWLDEIFSRNIMRASSLRGMWDQVKATESTPPLYYTIGWLVHARSAVAMRAITATALTVAVPVAYFALWRLLGRRAALAAAAVLAVSPMLVAYSTDARSYGLLLLTALLTVWAFSALLEASTRRRQLAWVAACAACVWTHYFGIFLVGAELALLLVLRPSARRATALSACLLAALLAPLVVLATSQAGDERAEFIAGTSLAKRVSDTARQFAMGPNVPRTALEAAGLAVFYAALVCGLWTLWRRPRREGAGEAELEAGDALAHGSDARGSELDSRILVALLAIAGLAPLALGVLGIEDRFYSRNLIALVPLAVAVAVPALLRLRAVPLAIYLALALATSLWVATDWRYEQVNWKRALARVERLDASAPVLAVTRASVPVVQTYLGRAPAAPPGVLAQHVWLVVEPIRRAGHRALGAATVPSLPGFTVLRSISSQGFTIELLGATVPAQIAPGAVPGATLFGPAR
jgi:Dolichyl-phosphate-mannose-protein mannosyltransferase